ncbi:zinc finger BED domain-containing protein RICESLEEPER 2 [Artemisia annua]|uniref:Zinc finger BED domain-containing protein RICESLEEPER 2 n=1 Tax=Artemisia annua TaxID=35608 RepID=A0A2U1NMH2_ARTAN|nr:zinc finger BED domain-containing protein RICESLEEPER 2 [Artemisia annua]
MLFASEKYEKAFSLFEILDPAFKHHLEKTCGVPDHDDWENARKVSEFLAGFWCLTKNMFEFDATSDTLIDRISRIEFKFCDWAKSADTKTKTMILKMREKYFNYWGNVEELSIDKNGTPQLSEKFQERLKKRKLNDEGNVRDDTEMVRYLTEDFVADDSTSGCG